MGRVTTTAGRLLQTVEAALWAGIEQARSGNHLGDVSAAIQDYIESNGFTVLRELTGHGVGRQMHEAPTILNYGQPGTGLQLLSGMTLALEPMASTGGWRTRLDPDGWTVRTADGSLSAHFEHTIAITSGAAQVLTVL